MTGPEASVVVAEVEVSARATRRRFTAKEKLRILDLADACTKVGEVGAMLRREGIYSSSLAGWRRAREAGELSALAPKRRGPKPIVPDARDRRLEELQRALARAEARARQAEGLVAVQKKIAELLGIPLPQEDERT
jgi:transposase-like protein